MENKFKMLSVLIKDFEIQCCFWSLWTKSRVKTNDLRDSADEAAELFVDFVEYWQGKTGMPLTFVDTAFNISAQNSKYFLWLDKEIFDILENNDELDLLMYAQKFKEIYFKLRGYLNV